MALSFFRRSAPKTPPLPAAVIDALVQLDRIEQERPTLAEPVRILKAILPAIFGSDACIEAPAHAREPAAVKMSAGIPLLRGEKLQINKAELQRRWESVRGLIAKHPKEEVQRPVLDPAELLNELLHGDRLAIDRAAEALGIASDLLAVAFRLTVFSPLAEVSASLAPVRDGLPWDQGYCPTCGSWPLLGELRGLEQSLFLRCGLCASDWPFPRLRCPFCGATDHRVLGFLSVEGEEDRRRAATCDACHGYVKLTSTLAALSPPELLVADVATLHLDLIAAERGYTNSPLFKVEPGTPPP